MEILFFKKGSDFPEIIAYDDADAIVMNDGKRIYDLWVHPRNNSENY